MGHAEHVLLNQFWTMMLLLGPGAVGICLTFVLVGHNIAVDAVNDAFNTSFGSYENYLGQWIAVMFAGLVLQGAGIMTYAFIYWLA